jgi:acyl-CoA thioester hydrolase
MVSIEEVEQLAENFRVTVNGEYLDQYGHMNVRWYSELWGLGAFNLMTQIGFGTNYMQERNYGTWVLRQIIDYLAEVHEGDTLVIRGRIIDRSDKMLHNKYWMVNETKNKIASTSEVLVGHADLAARRLAPYPEDIQLILDAKIGEYNGLGWPVDVSGAIHLKKK